MNETIKKEIKSFNEMAFLGFHWGLYQKDLQKLYSAPVVIGEIRNFSSFSIVFSDRLEC